MTPRYPKVGRRGAAMLVLVSLWIYIGILPLLSPQAGPIAGVPHTYLPTWVRVLIWVVPALVALAHVGRYRDVAGWIALALPPAERAVSYLWGWSLHLLPGPSEGYASGGRASILYIHMVVLVLILVGWREPVPLPGTEDTEDGGAQR